MTVAAATPRVQYTGNGVTLAFAFAQKVFTLTDIVVYREVISTGVTTVVDSSEYTVAGSALATGGYSDATVTFLVAPTTDHRITLVRATPKSQTNDYVTNAGFPADGHENAMDKLVMALQEMVYDISRCIKQNVSANGDLTFPSLIAGFLYSNGSSLEFKSLGDLTSIPTYGGSFLYGNDADKGAAPTKGDLYLATDTKKFYRCYVDGTWSIDTTFSIVTLDGSVYSVQGSAPATAAGQLAFYCKTVSGQPEWFYRKASNGAEIQVTSNGLIKSTFLPTITTTITGEVRMWAGALASPPAGWLVCDGASLLRADYADLFAVIGTTYGAADGTHFNLPNFTNRFPYGANEGASAGNASVGSAGGRTPAGNDNSVTAASGNNTAGNLSDAGAGSPVGTHTHDVMPPYLAVGFIIKT